MKMEIKIKAGDILVKKCLDLQVLQVILQEDLRVTEMFEAGNPSNPAVVSEVDGYVSFGKIIRGNE